MRYVGMCTVLGVVVVGLAVPASAATAPIPQTVITANGDLSYGSAGDGGSTSFPGLSLRVSGDTGSAFGLQAATTPGSSQLYQPSVAVSLTDAGRGVELADGVYPVLFQQPATDSGPSASVIVVTRSHFCLGGRGTVTISDVAFDRRGHMKSFAADYTIGCQGEGWQVAGSVRYRSTVPVAVFKETAPIAARLTAKGQRHVVTVRLAPRSRPVHFSAASFRSWEFAPMGNAVITDDTCSNMTISGGQSCSLTLYLPTRPTVNGARENLLITSDAAPLVVGVVEYLPTD